MRRYERSIYVELELFHAACIKTQARKVKDYNISGQEQIEELCLLSPLSNILDKIKKAISESIC